MNNGFEKIKLIIINNSNNDNHSKLSLQNTWYLIVCTCPYPELSNQQLIKHESQDSFC